MSNKEQFFHNVKKAKRQRDFKKIEDLNNKTKFLINFGGFYHSIHSDIIDYKLEPCLQWGDEETENQESYDFNINWKATYNDYSKNYIEELNEILQLNLKFIKINSPKFYNFETDKIEAEINENDFNKLKDTYLNSREFIDYVNEASKSRDGFTSFYNGFNEVIKEDEIFLQYMFDYILKEYSDDIENYIHEMDFEIIENN